MSAARNHCTAAATPRRSAEAAKAAWIAEQAAHFTPSDMDRVVRLWRGWDRADIQAARRKTGAAA